MLYRAKQRKGDQDQVEVCHVLHCTLITSFTPQFIPVRKGLLLPGELRQVHTLVKDKLMTPVERCRSVALGVLRDGLHLNALSTGLHPHSEGRLVFPKT